MDEVTKAVALSKPEKIFWKSIKFCAGWKYLENTLTIPMYKRDLVQLTHCTEHNIKPIQTPFLKTIILDANRK